MIVTVETNHEGTTMIRINNESCIMWIEDFGITLNDTIFPQNGVDYSGKKVKIVGVDLV